MGWGRFLIFNCAGGITFIHGDRRLDLGKFLSVYGYWVVMLFVGLESIGIPIPGETMLIAASVYAGTTHDLDIALVIAAASCGAVLGDNIGFWIGREFGYMR